MTQVYEATIAHFFCGAGGGGRGSAEARARIGGMAARFRVLGGIDVDPLACKDFEILAGAPALCADMATLQPADLRRFLGPVAPDMILTSPPCKGFSGLLPAAKAETQHYQDLNSLVLLGLHLALSTWDRPPRVIFMENVPRITSRGAELLAKARQLLLAHGYAWAEGNHDCGQVGGLGQHRRRYFLVARHRASMREFVYVPPRQRVRACGEVLSELPVPGIQSPAGGPMHELPRLSALNLLRLAAIPAGGDWRDLPGVVPEGAQRRSVHRRHKTLDWQQPAPTIGGSGSNGAAHVADPRILALGATADGAHAFKGSPGLMGVLDWQSPAQAVTGNAQVSGSNTPAAVADPRCGEYWNNYKVLGWGQPALTVASASRPGSGAQSVADPRVLEHEPRRGAWGVLSWDAPSATVTGSARASGGSNTPAAIGDPRALTCAPRAGAYGVLRWDEAAALVSGNLAVDNGKAAVADPRVEHAVGMWPEQLKAKPHGLLVIVAPDGTWHRPLSTLELAALQGFPTVLDGAPLVLAGKSHTRWRQAIGDAIPPPAARAVCEQILEALVASDTNTFRLSAQKIWVAHREEGAVIV
jgi:site-specific DNA-cytosine methylase